MKSKSTKINLLFGGLIVFIVVGGLLVVNGVRGEQSGSNGIKVGYVNLSRALESYDAYQKAKQELEDYHKRLQEKMSTREKELKKMREEMQFLSRSEQAQRRKEFMTKMQNFRAQAQESERMMQQKQAELLDPIRSEVQEVIGSLGEKKGLKLIKQYDAQSSDILWVSARVDITGDVIARLDVLEEEE